MIRYAKCDNDTRTSGLVAAGGDVMLAGTIGADPQPILAQVCTACGYIELYAPQPINRRETVTRSEELAQPEMAVESPIPTT